LTEHSTKRSVNCKAGPATDRLAHLEEETMKVRSIVALGSLAFAIIFLQAGAVVAAEVKVISTFGMQPVLNEIAPEFERRTGHKLAVHYGSSVELKKHIDAGNLFDVAILTPPVLDELTKQGQIIGATRAVLARSGMGLIVPAGAVKPDIGSAEAFKRTLLNAKSIAYAPEGITGRHMASVFERLGIAAEIKAKTKPQPNVERTVQTIAGREAELGFGGISAFISTPGIQLVGPLPPELQDYVVYTMGLISAAKEKQAADALISFLKSDRGALVLKAKGLEPISQH
jgi:molybdate transport system substrate-binding protein